MMYYFTGEKAELNELIKDSTLKSSIICKIRWDNMLIIKLKENEKDASYLMLKYGHLQIDASNLIPDRSPILYKDYLPKDLPDVKLLSKRRCY